MVAELAIDGAAIAKLMEYNPIQSDGVPFFSGTRDNLVVGAASRLSAANIQDAVTRVTDRSGQVPTWIIVPPALIMMAAHILNSTVTIAASTYKSTHAEEPNRATFDSVLSLCLCAELHNHDAWAVAFSLDIDNASPDAWVKFSGL